MNKFVFTPATKDAAKGRLALAGPSGSGKTYTALRVATALAAGSPIAVIDTERGSASKYSHKFAFNRLNMTSFDPRDLVDAIAAAQAGGHEVLVVDSMSHFWNGIGGMLELVDAAAKRSYGGNQFGGWKDANPIERRMIDALLAYDGHVIVTMRTKTEWVIEKDKEGRNVPRKIGLAPQQRAGIEYEFDVVGDMDLENTLTITKSRCEDLSGAIINRPGEDLAETMLAWLTDGTPTIGAREYRDRVLSGQMTADELLALHTELGPRGLQGAAVLDAEGVPVLLGDLIVSVGRRTRAAEREAAFQRAQRDEAAVDVYLADLVERISAAETAEDLRGLSDEVDVKHRGGFLIDEERVQFAAMIAAQANLKDAEASEEPPLQKASRKASKKAARPVRVAS